MIAKNDSKMKKIWLLSVALVAVVLGGILFIGAVSGWFGPETAKIDAEYYCDDKCVLELSNISVNEYEEMINSNKSFVVFIDQGGCATADKIHEFLDRYANTNKFTIFQLWYTEAKNSSLGEYVKFYPSVAVISHGKVIAWLRADSDEDAPAYNYYEDFENWMNQYIRN